MTASTRVASHSNQIKKSPVRTHVVPGTLILFNAVPPKLYSPLRELPLVVDIGTTHLTAIFPVASSQPRQHLCLPSLEINAIIQILT